MKNNKVVDFSIKQLLDCGVHFGHRTNYWSPKMLPFIYGSRNNTHIFDLGQTARYLNKALEKIKEVASQNGKILFVGTKKQAQNSIATHAKRCGQYYVNYRWLGGMMTNWYTISASLKTLENYEELLANENLDITKKERLTIDKKKEKLDNVLGGIRTLGGKPDLLVVIDCRNESLAVKEANKLGIPVVGVVDSNTNPEGVDYVIPGNDDAAKAIELYCYLVSEAILKGMEESLSESGAKLSAEEVVQLHQAALEKEEEAAKAAAAAKRKPRGGAQKRGKPSTQVEKVGGAKASEKKAPAKASEKKAEEKAPAKASEKKAEEKAPAKASEKKAEEKAPVKAKAASPASEEKKKEDNKESK